MDILTTYQSIRKKQLEGISLTANEKAFIELFHLIATISEHIVIYSKQEISSEKCIEYIVNDISSKI